MRIGYIGLGNKGAGMAEMIAREGHELVVWARRPGVVDPFVTLGATVAESPAVLAAQCQIVGTCVMADDDVISLATSMLKAMAPGSVFVNHATIRPDTARRLGEMANANGVMVIDAPVSGDDRAAKSKSLLVLAGGDKDALAAAQPMFDCYAKVIYCGALGDGQMAKLINNGLFYANMELAHRAFELATAFGMNTDLLRNVVAACSGGSFSARVEPAMFNPAAANHIASLAVKDVALLNEFTAIKGLNSGIVGEVAGRLVESISEYAAQHTS